MSLHAARIDYLLSHYRVSINQCLWCTVVAKIFWPNGINQYFPGGELNWEDVDCQEQYRSYKRPAQNSQLRPYFGRRAYWNPGKFPAGKIPKSVIIGRVVEHCGLKKQKDQQNEHLPILIYQAHTQIWTVTGHL